MKIPGVIGGLGQQTTADYYLRVQELAHDHESIARLPMLTWSVPLPYELEERSIFEGTGFDAIGDYLVEAAQRLAKAGADFVVMPCNTLHLLGKRIRDSIDIPFVSIIDETVKARTTRKMSQEKLAQESGIDRSRVGFIEQGRRKPTLSTLLKLAKSLDISLEQLFKGL